MCQILLYVTLCLQIRLPDLMSHSDLMRMEKQHMDLFWQSQKTRFENLQGLEFILTNLYISVETDFFF